MSKSINSSISNKTRSVRGAMTAALAVLALMMFTVGCTDPNDDDPNAGCTPGIDCPDDPPPPCTPGVDCPDNPPPPSGVIGDWRHINNNDNYFKIRSIKPSGDMCLTYFQKVDNFWIEANYCYMEWRVEDDQFIVLIGDNVFSKTSYSVSSNTFTITQCHEEDKCYTDHFNRVDLASLRSTMGTIRTVDPELFSGNWLRNDGEYLFFNEARYHMDSTSTVSRYFGEGNNYAGGYFYTEGTSIHLIPEIYDGVSEYTALTAATVTFTYAISSSGNSKTLTLTNTSLGINDVWTVTHGDDPPPPPSNHLVLPDGEAWLMFDGGISCSDPPPEGGCPVNAAYIFNTNYTFQLALEFESVGWVKRAALGTYSVNENSLTFIDGDRLAHFTFSISGDVLTLTIDCPSTCAGDEECLSDCEDGNSVNFTRLTGIVFVDPPADILSLSKRRDSVRPTVDIGKFASKLFLR